MKKINSLKNAQEQFDNGRNTPFFKRWMRFTSVCYLPARLVVLLLALLPFAATTAYARNYINVPLDPSDPVEFYGDYIMYHGQRIDLGPNALYIDGSLSTATANSYTYVFNEVDDDKANVKALRPYVN